MQYDPDDADPRRYPPEFSFNWAVRDFDSGEQELMEGPGASLSELRTTLRELETLNRFFAGHRYTKHFIEERFLPGGTYRVLDVATGAGDFPRAMVDWARPRCVELEIDAMDANPKIIGIAGDLGAGYPEIQYSVARAQDLHPPGKYDLVHCSLSLHHFSTTDAISLLARFRELTRGSVLVLDLERSIWTKLGVRLASVVLQHSAMATADGKTSVRRAFSFAEMEEMAKEAGWPRFGHERVPFCRQALWISD